jgi:hypothetical protein
LLEGKRLFLDFKNSALVGSGVALGEPNNISTACGPGMLVQVTAAGKSCRKKAVEDGAEEDDYQQDNS